MKLSPEQKEDLEASIPASDQVRKRLEQYLELTGMTPSEFADAAGCSYNKVKYFLRDQYDQISETDFGPRRDFWAWMQAHPVEPETKSSGKLYETRDYQLLRKYFFLALNRRRAYVVQADPGIGKTFCGKHLISELNRREISRNGAGRRAYFVRASAIMTPTQLLKEIALACGISSIGDSRRVLRALRRAFSGRSVVVVIDEAQQLSVAALESVRELLDEPPHCGLLIVGSHELERKFTLNSVELEQWNSRIASFRKLDGLSEQEARGILLAEMGELPEKVVRGTLKDCEVDHLSRGRNDRAHKYISARRLFSSIEDSRADDGDDAERASA